ncbi:glycosyltransferase [Klebsiella michiganensis]|uniref:glycosyltransferase n=1 Tax=Klebsiella michiganensis TaxID=1134687 RepID=UPI000C9B42CA|nr:glycosyltransferase [Klebsiella michiganensis]MBA7858592.1 glycosyltransferase [Klebsiella michiganensis]MBG2644922.1 glycosyltransferase [Klebsiella michiganensis]MBL0770494.1 glycosyltransferase [Klebsiella michiganensis]MBX4801048.1 glycosyltransferase [Klebsiella michiganensis]HDX8997587.1 glycosyltransferase [Klebsiella michiganensis]
MNKQIHKSISVIIPVYNVSQYVLQAVNSVLEQTIQPYEIIIVDDGSTDNSGALVEQHYSDIPYVTIIHTENQGLGEARNVGTRVATGDYIYYFDSDDVLESKLFEDFNNALDKHGDVDIFAFSAESFVDDIKESSAQPKKLPQYWRDENVIYTNGISAYCGLSRKGAFFPNAWIYLYKRELQVNNDLFFKPIIHEDEEFTPRLFFAAGKTIVTDKVYFRRRMRLGSIMHTKRTEKNVIGYIESIYALESLLSKHDNPVSSYLRTRIVSHLISIQMIKINNSLILSKTVESEFERLCQTYHSFFLMLAKKNIFAYKVCRFFVRRLGYKALL